LAISRPRAVDYIQVVGLIGFACGCGAFQAFLRRFFGDFGRFWTDFSGLRPKTD
jgi:hypothetical protein